MSARARLFCLTILLACGDETGPTPNPVPVVEGLSPAAVVTGSGSVTVTITGQNFVSGARILANNVERTTTVQGTTTATTEFAPNELTTPRAITLAVANPEPGGGTSGALQFLVTLPPPVIGTVAPSPLMAGAGPVTLRIAGRGFRPSSVVRWNGSDRPTRFRTESDLEVDLAATDLLVAMRARLAVANSALDGGADEIEVPVSNPQPIITAVSPARRTVGAGSFTLTVTGRDFVPGAVITWNGNIQGGTTFISSQQLTATIRALDIATAGTVQVGVMNPEPSLGVSAPTAFVVDGPIIMPLHAWDLEWDAARGRLYASVAADDARYPNEVVAIDPQTGNVVARVSPGLGPGVLAIADDGSKLYVTLDGEGAVARIDLTTFTRDLRFLVGTGSQGTLYAEDVEVLPGSPGTVAVSRMNVTTRPHHEGIALYDNGVVRAVTTPPRVGGNAIEFTSPTTLYGFNYESTGFELYRMDVSASGLTVRSETEGVVEGFSQDIRYGSGYLFSVGLTQSTGEPAASVVDATTGLLAATLDVLGLPCPEPAGGRVYYMTHNTLYAFSTTTWALIASEALPAGAPTPRFNVTRWGPDGFAYIGPTQVAIFRTDLTTR